jgi:hypothetical protein
VNKLSGQRSKLSRAENLADDLWLFLFQIVHIKFSLYEQRIQIIQVFVKVKNGFLHEVRIKVKM